MPKFRAYFGAPTDSIEHVFFFSVVETEEAAAIAHYQAATFAKHNELLKNAIRPFLFTSGQIISQHGSAESCSTHGALSLHGKYLAIRTWNAFGIALARTSVDVLERVLGFNARQQEGFQMYMFAVVTNSEKSVVGSGVLFFELVIFDTFQQAKSAHLTAKQVFSGNSTEPELDSIADDVFLVNEHVAYIDFSLFSTGKLGHLPPKRTATSTTTKTTTTTPSTTTSPTKTTTTGKGRLPHRRTKTTATRTTPSSRPPPPPLTPPPTLTPPPPPPPRSSGATATTTTA
eukprot:TRINITY_DN12871_c0_g1_i2.p1 TRINITY_DN12871_c0_g1~~TRINITY_DN12871_c0_g1_i2.p1  ORF type:complete len:287 (-),score=49.34 TRINITY_DN12871_c0_g1_i2:173-1033(-)